MDLDSVIVRFGGEIGIKGDWTRRTYEELVAKNIKKTLRHHGIPYSKIICKRGRIFVKTRNARETASKLTQVFGISSVSPAVETISNIGDIADMMVELAGDILKHGCSFAINCHRVGKHPYSSMQVCKETGKRILEKFESRGLEVNLGNPQFTINVDIRDDYAYIFSETLQGMDGFPLGSQPKVTCLLSGGLDSAVACWLAMKRGCPIVPVYFDIAPFADEAATTRALDVARKLFEWSIGFPRKAYIVPHSKNLEAFIERGLGKLTCILCKRMMYRIAERIAKKEKTEGLLTGESIGEQASQTLHNLRILSDASTEYPIHRPLLGFNKLETEKIAKEINTYRISTRKVKGCTAAPKKPATKARLDIIRKIEQELEIDRMIDKSISEAKIVTV